MRDEQCVRFLQWALPRLHLRWPGFRKVRRQVCKRLGRRIRELGLADLEAYRRWLGDHADEWARLDTFCRITISRFYRDRAVFDTLEQQVLPTLAGAVRQRGDDVVRIWSAGCGSGEEPYTVSLIWFCALQPGFPEIDVDIVATDVDPGLLRRARAGCYAFGSLKELPARWREQAFAREDGAYRLEPAYRRGVRFIAQDIREAQPGGPFDLVLCRNLVFTYFDEDLQRRILDRILETMRDGAALVLGAHEHLPESALPLSAWHANKAVYRKVSDAENIPRAPGNSTTGSSAQNSG